MSAHFCQEWGKAFFQLVVFAYIRENNTLDRRPEPVEICFVVSLVVVLSLELQLWLGLRIEAVKGL